MKAWLADLNEYVVIVYAKTRGQARVAVLRECDLDRLDFLSFPVRRCPQLDGEPHEVTDSEYYELGYRVVCHEIGCWKELQKNVVTDDDEDAACYSGHMEGSYVYCDSCWAQHNA